MSAARPLLWCGTGITIVGVGAFAFAIPGRGEDVSPWWTMLVFAVVGVMFTLISRPQRWWVALGFAWLLSAWVEAGQAVWMPELGRARIEDLILGCAGGTIGVLAVVAVRRIAAVRRRASPLVRVSAAAVAPRTR